MSELNKLNLSKWGIMMAMANGELIEYLQKNTKSKADQDFLRKLAKNVGSDTKVAGSYRFRPSAIDNALFGYDGPYYGQHIERHPTGWDLHDKHDWAEQNVLAPPHLLDIYLGNKPNTMQVLNYSDVPQNFYWSNPKGDAQPVVYDMTDQSRFRGFRGETNEMNDFWSQIDNLEVGAGLEIPEGIKADWYSSIDLGQYTPMIGKDEKGPYISVADIWDFEGGTGRGGKIMDMIEDKNPINLYSKHYIDKSGDRTYDRSLEEIQNDIPYMRAIKSIIDK